MISIIVPCKNEKDSIRYFYIELMKTLKSLKVAYEIIFVDDGSTDTTLEEFKLIKKKNRNIKIISFSRNFGKEAAMLAGFKESKGDYIVTMDVDLQDPPFLLKEMYEELKKGKYDCIGTRRVTRKGEPPIRSFFARCFYKLINKFIDVEIVDGARDYRMMTRQMMESVLAITEYHRFSKGIFAWVGFKTKYLAYENIERIAGETKWSFWKLFKYAIEGIVSFTTAPLMISFIFGSISFLIGLIYLIVCLCMGITSNSLLISIICIACGCQLIAIGILGEYVGKTFFQTKNRPIYIIKERL